VADQVGVVCGDETVHEEGGPIELERKVVAAAAAVGAGPGGVEEFNDVSGARVGRRDVEDVETEATLFGELEGPTGGDAKGVEVVGWWLGSVGRRSFGETAGEPGFEPGDDGFARAGLGGVEGVVVGGFVGGKRVALDVGVVMTVGVEFGAPFDIDDEAAVVAEEVEERGAGETVGRNFDGLKGVPADRPAGGDAERLELLQVVVGLEFEHADGGRMTRHTAEGAKAGVKGVVGGQNSGLPRNTRNDAKVDERECSRARKGSGGGGLAWISRGRGGRRGARRGRRGGSAGGRGRRASR